MPQRLTAERQLYYGVESTEGTEVVGGNSNAITLTHLAVGPDLAFNSRSIQGRIGRVAGRMGAQTNPGLSFTAQCRGGGTTIVPKLDPILAVVLGTGVSNSGADTTINTANSTTTVLEVASASGFSVGNAVAVETTVNGVYEVGWIQAKNTTGQHTLTLSHALTIPAPASGRNVRPSITYTPQDTGHGHLSLQMWIEGTPGNPGKRLGFVGCKGSMKFDAAAPGAVPTMTFNFDAMRWNTEDGTHPTPTWDTAQSPTSYKFKLDATAFNVKLASWDLRQSIAKKRSQNSDTGTIAQLVTNRDLMGFLQSYNEGDTQLDNWESGVEQAIAHQFGSTQYNMVAYQIPKAQRRRVSYGDDNGLTTDRLSFQGNITNGADEVRLAFL